MKITVLGSAAGGGFPQWNCNCFNCKGVREGRVRATPRTQSSLFVSHSDDMDGVQGLLVNASPDILAQIRAVPALQPARHQRDTAIAAVLLMDAQIDHVTGLLMLRESATPLRIYATATVLADLHGGLPLLDVLSKYCKTDEVAIPTDGSSFQIAPLENVEFSSIELSSKAPPYSPNRENPQPGDNIGLLIRDRRNGGSVFYAPGLGETSPAVLDAMARADVLLIDGTFWTEDEMIEQRLSSKPARAMGHIPQSGKGNMIELLQRFPDKRRILIHINNSNPILREDSVERAELTASGIEIAWDGMEIVI